MPTLRVLASRMNLDSTSQFIKKTQEIRRAQSRIEPEENFSFYSERARKLIDSLRPRIAMACSSIKEAQKRREEGALDDYTWEAETIIAGTFLLLSKRLEELYSKAESEKKLDAMRCVRTAIDVLASLTDKEPFRKDLYPEGEPRLVRWMITCRNSTARDLHNAVLEALDTAPQDLKAEAPKMLPDDPELLAFALSHLIFYHVREQ